MAEATTSTRPRRRGWLRWVGITVGALALLLVVAYFVGTSAWFLKSVILPKVSTAMNAKVTVDDASISPFSSVTLENLKVETKGAEPLLVAQEVRARYSLMDIIKGNMNISEVALVKPTITLITYPDGSSNLDPITKQEKKDEPSDKEPKEKKDDQPPQVKLGSLSISDAVIKKIDKRQDGTHQSMVLTVPSLTVNNIGNNQNGKIALAATALLNQGYAHASNGVITAAVNGNFDLALDADLKPKTVKGQTKVDVTNAKGAFEQAAGLGVVLNSDLTPTQLNDVSVRLSQSGNNLGAVTISGPFSADTMEGKLNVVLSQIDRQALNIVGGPMGMDFNQTKIGSTNTIELSQGGRMIAVNGQLLVGDLSLTQQGQTTPPLTIRSTYGLTYDQTNKTALIQTFALNGSQQGNEFLKGTLSQPMLLDLGKGSNAVNESAFDLVITNFNLANWAAFAGTNVSLGSGSLDVNLKLLSREAGKQLNLDLATRIIGLTAASGSNRIENADLTFSARGTVQNFSAVNLEQYRATLARAGQQALVASGALQYNTATGDADVQANLDVALPQVTSIVSVPDLTLREGTLKFDGRVIQKNTPPQQTNNPVLDRSVTGKVILANLTGRSGSNTFDRFAADMDVNVAMRGDAVDIKKLAGSLQQSGQAGGAFDVAGTYNTQTRAAQITARIIDLNQHALKSFVAGALGDKQLESVSINANTTAKMDGVTDGTVKAEVRVANLVVNDPSGAVPRTPLAMDLNADVAMAKQVIDLRTVQLALTKTERAPNSLNVAGRVDLSKSNAYTGDLKITSPGLDVTPYYEIFSSKNTNTVAATNSGAAAPRTEQAAKPESEPEPMNLPVSRFGVDVNIASFYLREIAISNMTSRTMIENGRINVNPFSLSLNGAPVSFTALANVGVRGYQYDVNLNMDRVPVEPLVNTFEPERHGKVKGDLLAAVQIKGAGITGPSLQTNLGGNIGITLTNGDVTVSDSPWLQKILRPLAAALATPELAESPLRWIDARVGIGSGTVTLTNSRVESSLLRGNVHGTITLNEVITNSTLNNLPVELEFRRSLVGKIKFLRNAGSGDWIALPTFYHIGGTIGQPNPRVDTAGLAKIAAAEALKNVKIGGEAGRLLEGFGIGGGSRTNEPSGTNAPPGTNALGNLIQGILGGGQSPNSTNTTETNTPPATNAVGNLLRGLGGFLERKSTDTNAQPRRR